ncbi:hypothetical protein SteCoe_28171 [Stentor coeruleus]|uniref:Non-specific serine/threonine protein kinase n=1 Tax=Stentor coeruleus TaxID=5963 RepID=A0A1R2B8U6_9CILI|nr:hypothetical protein SteCoe_28171 [Stentor coeruleus]
MGCASVRKTSKSKVSLFQDPKMRSLIVEKKVSTNLVPVRTSSVVKIASNYSYSPNQDIKIEASLFVNLNSKNIQENYDLMEKISEGDTAFVRKAFHKTSRKYKAVKSVEKIKTSNNKDNLNLVKEFNTLKKLDHPNIVKVFECYEDSTYMHTVLEHLPGGQLIDYLIKSNMLSEQIAARIMKQILSALSYCHEKKIIHTDIRSEHILFDSKSENSIPKLISFGKSIIKVPVISNNGKLSRLLYTAPEILNGEPYTAQSDIWSCGVLLYILLSGKPPFAGKTQEILKQRVKTGDFSLKGQEWAKISSPAIELLNQMLVYNPSSRISAKAAMQSPWIKACLSGPSLSPNDTLALKNLSSFRTKQKLQQIVLVYIANNALSKERLSEMTQTFQKLDKDGDGKISKEELIEAYLQFMSQERAVKEVEAIMKTIDTNNSGFIDYTEFAAACLKREDIEDLDNLDIAFKAFDTDGSGKISAQELRELLCLDEDQSNSLRALLNEIDENGDGQIDIDEFRNMMIKHIN